MLTAVAVSHSTCLSLLAQCAKNATFTYARRKAVFPQSSHLTRPQRTTDLSPKQPVCLLISKAKTYTKTFVKRSVSTHAHKSFAIDCDAFVDVIADLDFCRA